MNRFAIPVLLLAASLAAGQDMPLHEILKPGEDWRATDGDMPKAATTYSVDRARGLIRLGSTDIGTALKHPLKTPMCCAVSLGGSTLLVADADDRYVWALRIEAEGSLGPGDRYCRLRVAGDDRRKNSPAADFRADPSAIVVDAANRMYVATNLGIQVFDPTGRLCGVFTAPPGRVTELTFDGDLLFARAGDKVFIRRMLAHGAK